MPVAIEVALDMVRDKYIITYDRDFALRYLGKPRESELRSLLEKSFLILALDKVEDRQVELLVLRSIDGGFEVGRVKALDRLVYESPMEEETLKLLSSLGVVEK